MAQQLEVRVPDVGDADGVTIAEVLVEVGDTVEEDDSLVTLESDKASMEIPAPAAGKVVEIRVKVDDEVGENAAMYGLPDGARVKEVSGKGSIMDWQAKLNDPSNEVLSAHSQLWLE